jgi:hypothetical protein
MGRSMSSAERRRSPVTTVAPISDSQIAKLVRSINDDGYGVIHNFIEPDDLARMRTFVHKSIDDAGGYVSFAGTDQVRHSGLDEISVSPEFTQLLHKIYERETGNRAPDEGLYFVLRCLTGESGQKNSLIFHYDSYLLTALIPIAIPEKGMRGDLAVLPNVRKLRGHYMRNVIDKLILDNPVSQAILRFAIKHNLLRVVRIPMVPGSIYFFWGYRSIHANEPCDPNEVRATALFHFANPHAKFTKLRGREPQEGHLAAAASNVPVR